MKAASGMKECFKELLVYFVIVPAPISVSLRISEFLIIRVRIADIKRHTLPCDTGYAGGIINLYRKKQVYA